MWEFSEEPQEGRMLGLLSRVAPAMRENLPLQQSRPGFSATEGTRFRALYDHWIRTDF